MGLESNQAGNFVVEKGSLLTGIDPYVAIELWNAPDEVKIGFAKIFQAAVVHIQRVEGQFEINATDFNASLHHICATFNQGPKADLELLAALITHNAQRFDFLRAWVPA